MSIFTQEQSHGRSFEAADNQRHAFASQYRCGENRLNQTPAPKKCVERAGAQAWQALHSFPWEAQAVSRGLSLYQERCAPFAPRRHAGLLAMRSLPPRQQVFSKWPRQRSFAPRPEHQHASLKPPFAFPQSITCSPRFAEGLSHKDVAA